jgi:hypothetical protein
MALAIAARVEGWTPFHAYPGLSAPVTASVLLVAAGLVIAAWLPFCERRGVER